jgi:hypothetical protein
MSSTLGGGFLIPVSFVIICVSGACKPPVTPEVSEYLKQIPKVDSMADASLLSPIMYYARKDTLRYSGNIVYGNWILGTSTGACTSKIGGSLLLTHISNFDEILPCGDGTIIVRARVEP